MRSWSRVLLIAVPIFASCAVSVHAQPKPRTVAAYAAEAKALVASMTLDEKVGQMTQAEQHQLVEEKDIETFFLGSLLSGGDSDPKTNSLADWTDMYDRYQAHTAKTRLRIPILYGVDAVHGHNNVIGATVFPHNVGLGAARAAALVEEIGRATAREGRATGIQWAFAPCVAVARDERWGRAYESLGGDPALGGEVCRAPAGALARDAPWGPASESFGEAPALVAELGGAAVRGLQGTDLSDPQRVLACAKHFAGDGGTTYGSGQIPVDGQPTKKNPLDQGDTRLSEDELKRLHMQGYLTAIAAGVGSIMPSYNSWNGEKCSGSKRLLTEILKGELQFDGFLISDYDAIDQLPGDYRADIKQSINAGMDMVMVPKKYREFFTTLKDLVEKGEVPMARVDDAVTRIPRGKLAMGLMAPDRSQLADRALQASFGSAAHRDLARRAVRESLVLLKNDRRALPLSKTAKRIHVTGKNSDDVGSQMGGWTITWQGQSGNPGTPGGTTMTGGTTILAGLKAAAGSSTQVTYAKDGSGAAGAGGGGGGGGGTPYAEVKGGREGRGAPT